jgi:adenylate kinase
MTQTPVLVLLGPPGSGKGTQAKELTKIKSAWVHISTGDLFRKEIASGSLLGQELQKTLAAGNLVSDDQTNQVFKSQVMTLKKARNPELFILDGYPRTGPQSRFLVSLLGQSSLGLGKLAMLELEVNEDAVVDRLSGRMSNPRTGRIYHTRYSPPKRAGFCDEDGGPLVQRDDDREEVIRSRFAIFKSQKEAILEGLKAYEHLKINGEGKAAEISQMILKKVGSVFGI